MATKRRICDACRVHTICRKCAFKGDDPENPSFAYICTPCIEKYNEEKNLKE